MAAKQRKPLFLDLSMNPLECDCALANKLTKEDIRLVGDLDATLCSAPEALRGHPPSKVIKLCEAGEHFKNQANASNEQTCH